MASARHARAIPPTSRRRRAAAGVLLLLGLGCAARARPTAASATGRYALVAVGGRALPAYATEIPIDRDPTRGTCPGAITAGWLTLDVERGRFEYAVDVRNMCSGWVVSAPHAEGFLMAAGRTLRFGIPIRTVQPPRPPYADPLWFPGTVDGPTVTVHAEDVMVFRRAHSQPVSEPGR